MLCTATHPNPPLDMHFAQPHHSIVPYHILYQYPTIKTSNTYFRSHMVVGIFVILWLYMPAYFLIYLVQEMVGLDLLSIIWGVPSSSKNSVITQLAIWSRYQFSYWEISSLNLGHPCLPETHTVTWLENSLDIDSMHKYRFHNIDYCQTLPVRSQTISVLEYWYPALTWVILLLLNQRLSS